MLIKIGADAVFDVMFHFRYPRTPKPKKIAVHFKKVWGYAGSANVYTSLRFV
jgi:hypothetical protein